MTLTKEQKNIIFYLWDTYMITMPFNNGSFPNKNCERDFKAIKKNFDPLIKKHKITLKKIKSYLDDNQFIGCYGDYRINEDIFYSDFQVIFKMFK